MSKKLQVTFYPDVKKEYLDSSATVSEISWGKMRPHLDKIFSINKSERLAGITVTEYSIKAKIEKI